MEKKLAFDQFIEQQLNAAQKKAVQHVNGPLLVIAGAGSGKTRVITARIVNLLVHHNVSPHEIVALTFTNKAAKEMQERIIKFIGKGADKPFIGTFHSYCLFLLRRYAHLVDLPTFSILDADDQTHMLQGIIKRAFLEKRLTAKSLGYQISNIKNHVALDPQNIGHIDPFIYQLYQAYEKEKEASKCIDFDDLLLKVHYLFSKNKEFRYTQQNQVRHLLVDEYQDTNLVQHALLKHMALDESTFAIDSLCAVGDEDQSIYSWRGATVANIMNFKKDFKKTETITIETNYRSVQPILQTANTVISHNSTRHPKKLVSDRKANDRVRALRCMSAYQEGEILANFVETLRKKDKNNTVAVLYRAHYQSRSLEEALIRHNIPYKIIGGIQFYERKEIKDILAYLRLVTNPFDRVSFIRAINTPARGLGDKFVEEFHAIWEHEPLFVYAEVAQHMIKEGLVKGKKAETLMQFVSILKGLSPDDAPSKAIQKIVDTTRYLPYLQDTNDPKEAESRTENVKELIRASAFFEQTGVTSIRDFLHEIALMQEKAQAKDTEEESVVQLMTLHAAKGLEFDAVMLPGLEEGVFPSTRSTLEPENMEEERRLLYVGITRAKERLLLSHSRYRTTYGQMLEQSPSRFIRELPTHLVGMTDCAPWNTLQFKQYFAEWLGINTISSVMTFGTATPQQKVTTTVASFTQKPKPSSGALKVNQLVKHAKFGVGLVKEIEQRGDDVFVSAQFKSGLKMVKATFLERM
ncbi:MAG: ATP-dependent helicase [Candidatus Babeliales bacterium]